MDKTFAHIQIRRDTEERWERLNPELLEGEWGFEVDTGKAKIGIGKEWNDTDYFGGEIDGEDYALKEELAAEKDDRIQGDIALQKQIALIWEHLENLPDSNIDLSQYATIEQLEGEIENRINADILLQKQIAELREQFIKVLENLDGIDGEQIEILVNGVVTLDQFNDLLEKLEREIAYRIKGDADLEDGLKAEKEDRQRADALIENHIARLRQDLEAIEFPDVDESRIDALESKHEKEVAYRATGDKELWEGLRAEKGDRQNADQKIENHIARLSQKVDAIEVPDVDESRVDVLEGKLQNEVAYRVEGDKALQEQIDSVVSYDDSLLRESLEQEKVYRIEGDKQAAEDLAREIKQRENGDNDLQESIEREKAFRVQGDQEQVEMIKAEKSDRQQADQAIENHVAGVNDDSKKRDAALGQVVEGHKVDSVNADAYLQRQIAKLSEEFDKLIAGIDGIDGEEITVLLQSAASLEDLNAISEKIEKEIAYRVQGDQLLLEQLQALEARFDALKGYDDSDLREKLEAEKGYRVEEDQKLQEQIDEFSTDFVKVSGGDTMEGQLIINGPRKAGDDVDNPKLVSSVKVLSIDNAQNSSLQLRHSGNAKVYVGDTDISIASDIKFNRAVGSVIKSNVQDLLNFGNQEIAYLGRSIEDEDLITKKYVDDTKDFLQNEIIELEEEIEAIAPSTERGTWAYNPVGNVAAPGAYTMYTDTRDNGLGSVSSTFAAVKNIALNERDLNNVVHNFGGTDPGDLLEIFEEGDDDYGLYSIIGIEKLSNPNPGGISYTYISIDVNLERTGNGDKAETRARFKVFKAPSGGDASGFVMKSGDKMTGDLFIDKTVGGNDDVESRLTIEGSRPSSTNAAATIKFINDQSTDTGFLSYRSFDGSSWFGFNRDIDLSTCGLHSVGQIRMQSGGYIGAGSNARLTFNNANDATDGSGLLVVPRPFDNRRGFTIRGNDADGDEQDMLYTYTNDTGTPDAVNYVGKMDTDKNLVNKAFVDNALDFSQYPELS